MISIGVQTKNVVYDSDPAAGFEMLKNAGIYVRHFQQPARIRNYLRITIGTKEEMEALFACLEQYVKS